MPLLPVGFRERMVRADQGLKLTHSPHRRRDFRFLPQPAQASARISASVTPSCSPVKRQGLEGEETWTRQTPAYTPQGMSNTPQRASDVRFLPQPAEASTHSSSSNTCHCTAVFFEKMRRTGKGGKRVQSPQPRTHATLSPSFPLLRNLKTKKANQELTTKIKQCQVLTTAGRNERTQPLVCHAL